MPMCAVSLQEEDGKQIFKWSPGEQATGGNAMVLLRCASDTPDEASTFECPTAPNQNLTR
eukprot:1008301-Pelagomonas_calceolata.AAC.12